MNLVGATNKKKNYTFFNTNEIHKKKILNRKTSCMDGNICQIIFHFRISEVFKDFNFWDL